MKTVGDIKRMLEGIPDERRILSFVMMMDNEDIVMPPSGKIGDRKVKKVRCCAKLTKIK